MCLLGPVIEEKSQQSGHGQQWLIIRPSHMSFDGLPALFAENCDKNCPRDTAKVAEDASVQTTTLCPRLDVYEHCAEHIDVGHCSQNFLGCEHTCGTSIEDMYIDVQTET